MPTRMPAPGPAFRRPSGKGQARPSMTSLLAALRLLRAGVRERPLRLHSVFYTSAPGTGATDFAVPVVRSVDPAPERGLRDAFVFIYLQANVA